MKVLRANQEQYEELNGYFNNFNQLIFTKDNNGEWIVGMENIHNPAFIEIREELEKLDIIDFNPIIHTD